MSNPLHNRTCSGFPLSASTGLAFESLFKPRQEVLDVERENNKKIPITDYKIFWINVQTLIRNIINATTKDDMFFVKPEHMYETVLEEMETIESILKEEGAGLLKPHFYFNNYSNLVPARNELIKPRSDSTPNKQKIAFLVENVKATLPKERKDIISFQYLREYGQPRSLMLSSFVPDLLKERFFSRLDLLESHTGKLKAKHQWNSKYYSIPNDSLDRLPFCLPLLYIFGDNALLSPMPIKIRKAVLELSRKRQWNPLTTVNKVHSDFTRLEDSKLASQLSALPLF